VKVHRRKPPGLRIVLILAGLISSLGCFSLGYTAWQYTSYGQLFAARARWASRPITHYRLTVEQELVGGYSSLVTCREVSDVRDERVLHIATQLAFPCQLPLQTVSQLFDYIGQTLWQRNCGPNGCSCDGPIDAMATYDSQHGYPQQVNIGLRLDQRQLYAEFWRRRWFGGHCSLIRYYGSRIRVLSLEPLP
jgi:hypothetical protein